LKLLKIILGLVFNKVTPNRDKDVPKPTYPTQYEYHDTGNSLFELPIGQEVRVDNHSHAHCSIKLFNHLYHSPIIELLPHSSNIIVTSKHSCVSC
jgi:hypothetical protein